SPERCWPSRIRTKPKWRQRFQISFRHGAIEPTFQMEHEFSRVPFAEVWRAALRDRGRVTFGRAPFQWLRSSPMTRCSAALVRDEIPNAPTGRACGEHGTKVPRTHDAAWDPGISQAEGSVRQQPRPLPVRPALSMRLAAEENRPTHPTTSAVQASSANGARFEQRRAPKSDQMFPGLL